MIRNRRWRRGIFCLMAGCGLLGSNCQSPYGPAIPLSSLLAAPLQIEIDGRTYTLETVLWRDFMPPGPPEGSDLAAVVYIVALDGLPFPAAVSSDRLWVINGNDVWETQFAGEIRPRDQTHLNQLEKYASGGPKWEIGSRVEVVVRVHAGVGLSWLLRASDQPIGSTH